jgi:hypothetical protein
VIGQSDGILVRAFCYEPLPGSPQCIHLFDRKVQMRKCHSQFHVSDELTPSNCPEKSPKYGSTFPSYTDMSYRVARESVNFLDETDRLLRAPNAVSKEPVICNSR